MARGVWSGAWGVEWRVGCGVASGVCTELIKDVGCESMKDVGRVAWGVGCVPS